MSVRPSMPLPRACSGDTYCGVPRIMPLVVSATACDPTSRSLAIPQSTILTTVAPPGPSVR